MKLAHGLALSMRAAIIAIVKKIATQIESGQQVTTLQGLGVWRLTGVGTYATSRADIEAAGGSRKVCLPNSTLRIGDVEWEPVRDVVGKVIAWRRSINGIPCFILNSPSPRENAMTKKQKISPPAEGFTRASHRSTLDPSKSTPVIAVLRSSL